MFTEWVYELRDFNGMHGSRNKHPCYQMKITVTTLRTMLLMC